MIIKLTPFDSQVNEISDNDLIRINSDNIQYYKRSRDATVIYLVGLQSPLTVIEHPRAIDKLIKGGKK